MNWKLDKKCCRCGSTKNLTKDHIIPTSFYGKLALPDMFNDPENLQTMCKDCNQLKGSLIDHKNPKTYFLLKKAIERWAYHYKIERKKNVYVFKNLKVKHDTTTYIFSPYNHTENLINIYKKQHRV